MITHFGLDIGAYSIKVAQIQKDTSGYRLVRVGMADNPIGSQKPDSDTEIISLAETIKKLVVDAKINTKEVAVSLPESEVYTQVIALPKMPEDQLEQAVIWEAENVIPRPLAEVSFSWKIVNTDTLSKDEMTKILLVAAPIKIVERYTKLIKSADLDPRIMETEIVSIGRMLKLTHPNSGSMAMVQIGRESTDVVIYRNGEVFVSRSIPTAGEALTRGITVSLGLDPKSSEEYKKTYGLSSQLEGKIASSLAPVLESLSVEIKKTLHNYEQKENNPVRLIVLAGGTVLMPGIVEYFTQKLGLEVQLADPTTIIGIDDAIKPVMKKNAPVFLVSFGLAIANS